MVDYTHQDALAHYGVKGMRWGLRKSDPGGALAGIPNKTVRAAKKDAEEFTRAKMYYGEGAGTRRKLIKATVESKSARDPSYKKAFDHHVSNTDLGKRAAQARGQRKRTDVRKGTAKTARGVSHILRGNSQYASAVATFAVGGYMYAKKTGIDKQVASMARKTMNDVKNFRGSPSERYVKQFLKDMGM